MFSKSENYYFDQVAIKENCANGNGLKNKRSVWSINTEPCIEAHFAVFPKSLVKPCILAGSKPGDVILDPFYGTGTVGEVALELDRKCVGIELNTEYLEIAKMGTRRVQKDLIPVG